MYVFEWALWKILEHLFLLWWQSYALIDLPTNFAEEILFLQQTKVHHTIFKSAINLAI